MNEQTKAILAVLPDAKQRGQDWLARCPAHDDKNPSLWVSPVGGKALWHCFSGCSQEAVQAALRARGVDFGADNSASWRPNLPPGVPLFYPTAKMLARNGEAPGPDTQKIYRAHYPYRDANGAIIGHVVRYERDGRKDTIPFFRLWRGGEWRSGHSVTANRPLYGLDKLAASPCAAVWVVEGEKCADAFNRAFGELGLVAVSWPGGSKSVKKADWSPIAGRDCILWCDVDAPGVSAMRVAQSCLLAIGARSVRFLDIFSIGLEAVGADCVDWLDLNPLAEAPPAVFLDAAPEAAKLPKAEAEKATKAPDDNKRDDDDKNVKINSKFPLTEFGNVERFLAAHASDVLHTPESGWFSWRDSRWVKDETKLVYKMAVDVLRAIPSEVTAATSSRDSAVILRWANNCQKNSSVNALINLLTAEQSLNFPYSGFDSDPYLLNTPSGCVDLRTATVRPHNRKDYQVHQTNSNYRPGAACPNWLNFLDYAFEGQIDIIEYFQRAVGYCLTGDTSEQVFFATEGPGAAGKGVAFETLAYILGSYANSIKAETFLLDFKGSAATGDNSIAAIRGARLCLSSEINPGAKLNEARVKELTGQDTIQARFLYREFFNFTPVAKFWLRCNGLPLIQGGDSGIWRRIRLLPFKRAVEKHRLDQYLRDKLKSEADGVLTWCVEGCLAWQKKRLSPPTACDLEALKYREDMDVVGLWLNERCVFDANAKTSSTVLYESYISWCEVQGESPKSQRWLAFELRSRGFARVRIAAGSIYTGVRLRNEGMAQEKFGNQYNI